MGKTSSRKSMRMRKARRNSISRKERTKRRTNRTRRMNKRRTNQTRRINRNKEKKNTRKKSSKQSRKNNKTKKNKKKKQRGGGGDDEEEEEATPEQIREVIFPLSHKQRWEVYKLLSPRDQKSMRDAMSDDDEKAMDNSYEKVHVPQPGTISMWTGN